jgi:hypothetical protein
MIIATICPNNYFMPFDAVKCWLQLPAKYSYYAVEGPNIPDNRNRVLAYAKKMREDLLFIDSDMTFTPTDVEQIAVHLKLGLHAVTGVYVLGRPPYQPAIFKRVVGDYELCTPEAGIAEIGACGAGFLGISKQVVQELPDNAFSNVWEGDIQHGEDISFCHRLHDNNFKLWCDSSILLGQVRTFSKYYEAVHK